MRRGGNKDGRFLETILATVDLGLKSLSNLTGRGRILIMRRGGNKDCGSGYVNFRGWVCF